MSDELAPRVDAETAPAPHAMPQPAYGGPQSYPPPQPYGVHAIGTVRGTGVCILLMIVTLGIYSWYWYYKVHEEMKRHTGDGIGGAIALVIAIFAGIASPYITSHEVGKMYDRRGHAKPVSAMTGLWVFPGCFLLVGPIVWFVKTNGALNAYWRSLGAR